MAQVLRNVLAAVGAVTLVAVAIGFLAPTTIAATMGEAMNGRNMIAGMEAMHGQMGSMMAQMQSHHGQMHSSMASIPCATGTNPDGAGTDGAGTNQP